VARKGFSLNETFLGCLRVSIVNESSRCGCFDDKKGGKIQRHGRSNQTKERKKHIMTYEESSMAGIGDVAGDNLRAGAPVLKV
jgi:hypothetical protein